MSLQTLALAALLAAPAAQASSTLGDLPRFELQPTGLLLAAKAKPADAKAEAADDAADVVADTEKKANDTGEEVSTALPDEEVKVGGTVLGESVGGATGFVFKQGFYTQADLGGFFVFGNALGSPTGFSIAKGVTADGSGIPNEPVPTSQLQPYIGLSVGYDIAQWLGVQLSFGTGFVANAAVYNVDIENPRDYGLTNIDLAVVGSFYVLERLAISGKLFGGATFMSPAPAPDEPTIGGNVGVGAGVRYATLLPDVFVGIDVNMLVAFVPAAAPKPLVIVPGFFFAPVIKYVF